MLRPALTIIAVGCGLAVQIELFSDHNLPGGVPWFLLSVTAWIAWCFSYRRDASDLPSLETGENPPSFLLKRKEFRNLAILLALQMTVLAVALYWYRPPKYYHWDIFGLWAAGMVLYLLAFWPALRGHPTQALVTRTGFSLFLLTMILTGRTRFVSLWQARQQTISKIAFL